MITNRNNIDLPMAVWLASDEYDGINEGTTVSVTTLLKPIKATILSSRITTVPEADISDLIPSRLGTAIHDAIERAWKANPKKVMELMGLPKGMYEELRVNPEEHDDEAFNVYLEQRVSREFMGFTINGQYDLIFDGEIQDIKTTGTFTWETGAKDEDYIKQLSVYRWLNTDKVEEEYGTIHFIFTDWKKLDYIKNPKTYPPLRVQSKRYKLMSLHETEQWLRDRLTELRSYWDLPQDQLPICTPKELWQRDPVYKYYKDPNNRKRSSGNFATPEEADRKRRESGGVGIIVPVYGSPTACLYCSAMAQCEQAQSYIRNGTLKTN